MAKTTKKLAAKKPAAKKTAVKKAPAKVKKAPAKKTPAKKLSVRKLLSKHIAQAISIHGTSTGVLDRLATVIASRRGADPELSHSARLLSRGTAKVAQKFGEEAVECVIEAISGNRAALIAESADVLYHLLLLWEDAGVATGEVWAELERREGISGIAEKASRTLPARLTQTTKIP
jgi:phosphoribosyl-ATP pyrophosphohydrolase